MDGTTQTRMLGRFSRVRGFSLYELIATLAISSFLITVAIPSLSSLVLDAKVSSAKSSILTMLAKARTEAVDKRQRIGICRTTDHISCASFSKSGTNAWNSALIFLDANYNNRFDNTELTLGWVDLDIKGIEVTWNRGDMVIYDSDGTARGGSNGTFKVITSEGEQVGVVISLTGRYRVTTY